MNIETIFDSPEATLWYHPESKIIHHKIHKPMPTESLTSFLYLGTHTMAEKSADKWLSEDQSIIMVDLAAIKWSKEVWFPDTVKAGWKFWAIVQPKHMVSQISMEKIAKEYKEQGITTQFFSNPDDALKWLESL
jgi:hypothetical protein